MANVRKDQVRCGWGGHTFPGSSMSSVERESGFKCCLGCGRMLRYRSHFSRNFWMLPHHNVKARGQ